jgi:hypothetical protein
MVSPRGREHDLVWGEAGWGATQGGRRSALRVNMAVAGQVWPCGRQGLILCSYLSCSDELAMCPWGSRSSQLRWWRTPTSRFHGGMWGAVSNSTTMTPNHGWRCSCCLGWASPGSSSSRCSPTCKRPAFKASSSALGKLLFVCLSCAMSTTSAVLNSEDALY